MSRKTPAKGHDVVVTVRPLGDGTKGGGNVELRPHLESIGRDVGEAFSKMIAAVGEARPDELKVTLSLKLEGTTNWVVAGAKAEGAIEVEGTWRRAHETSKAKR